MRTAAKLGGLQAVVAATAWLSAWLTARSQTPEHIRVFRQVRSELVAHASGVRAGTIPGEPTDDGANARQYPTPAALRRYGITCKAWGEVIVYRVWSLDDPHDGRSPHFVTPLDERQDAERLAHTFGWIWDRWEVLDSGKWAYWYGL